MTWETMRELLGADFVRHVDSIALEYTQSQHEAEALTWQVCLIAAKHLQPKNDPTEIESDRTEIVIPVTGARRIWWELPDGSIGRFEIISLDEMRAVDDNQETP